jgi:hypothetical protein
LETDDDLSDIAEKFPTMRKRVDRFVVTSALEKGGLNARMMVGVHHPDKLFHCSKSNNGLVLRLQALGDYLCR